MPGETLYVYLSVSEHALSAVLVTEREGTLHPVYFISHTYKGAEVRYSKIEKMVFALIMASRKLKPYFQAHPIKVPIGQPIRKIIENKNHLTRMTEWEDQLADFELEYEQRSAIKAQALAIFISCLRPPDIEIRESWELQVDGSATKSGNGVGLVIIPSVGEKMEYPVKFDFLASNKKEKYEALILGVQICNNAGAQNIMAKSDSQLIVGQVSGEYDAKEDNMRMYPRTHLEVDLIQHSAFPCSENQQSDVLARMASSTEGLTPRSIIWEVLNQPSIYSLQVHTINRTDIWMEELIRYLKDRLLPLDEKKADTHKRKAGWFIWHKCNLHKKSYIHPLLKCVTPFDRNYILREIHEGACSSHQRARTIAGKALRAEYYWPTLKHNADALVMKCPNCQLHRDIPQDATNPLATIQVVLPFDK